MSELFPELQDSSERKPTAVPLGNDPAGKRLVGADFAVAKYKALLALPGPFTADGGLRLESVWITMETGRIALEVQGGGIGPCTLHIHASWPDAPGAVDFFIGLEGDVPSVEVQQALVYTQERLSRARYAQLVKIVLLDPQKRIELLPQRGTDVLYEGGDEQGMDSVTGFRSSVVHAYASDLAWREFFADREQVRNFRHALRGRIVMVEHGDLECHYATPNVGDGTMSFFNYSNAHDRRVRDPFDLGGEAESHDQFEPTELITDMDERDVIMGGAAKMYSALSSLAKRRNPPELVIARGTCVPIVIGDDLRGSIDRFQKESGIETVFLDDLADGKTDPFQVIYNRVSAGWGAVTPEERQGRLNLVGYPSHTSMGELVQALQGVGIVINAMLVPDVELATLRRFARAELAVFFDSALFQVSYDRLFSTSTIPQLRPPNPFGPSACRAWLLDVATAMGRGEAAPAAWDALWATHAPAWEMLRQEAIGYRLGFVLDERRLAFLREPRDLTGVPMLEFLLEQGFALDFLWYGEDDAPLRAAMADLDTRAVEPCTMTPFSTPAELETALRESSAVAFCSELFFDRRLSRTGKAQFSVRDFVAGPAGAVETARRLIRVCRLPFYRVYADHLGEAFAGAES